MIGAILGDVIGSAYEFNPTNDYDFELFTESSSFTDDTICTIAVADALLKGNSFEESLRTWCRKYPNPKGGYGYRFSQWVMSEKPKPYNSFGNGSAMRVSPVAYWYKNEKEVLDAAALTALPSHNHPEGIKGAQTVALAIFKALEYNSCGKAADHIDEIIKYCVAFSGYNIDIPKSSVLNKFDETCQGTVPVALKIIKKSKNFEDAIRSAVCLGADADTLGAIVGSIAEAIWDTPSVFYDKFQEIIPDEMRKVVEEFQQKL